jgi:antitoxin (DNA-binding transcriptional repressor) of toxin-antitoxin stability system
MLKVNMHETKSRLSELVCLAEQGEIVIVARNGEPVVELKPVEKRRRGKAFLALGYTPTRILSRVGTKSFPWRRFFLTGSQSEGIAGYPYPDCGPSLRRKTFRDRAREVLGDPRHRTLVSIASAWGIANRQGMGKLPYLGNLNRLIDEGDA